jgi:cysteine synthase B
VIVDSVTELIGETPLLRIPREVHGLEDVDLYAKLEYLNPFGSLKDRIAWGILRGDIDDVRLQNRTVIESSSGNMAKALQALCSMHGIDFQIITNRIKIPEVKRVLQMLGTRIEELPGLSECPDPTDPNDPLTYIEDLMARQPGKYHHTSQYVNPRNVETHYATTGAEIQADLGSVDYFIGGLGTAGSTRGCVTRLRESNPGLRSVGVIANRGELLPGIRNIDEMYEVGIFDRGIYDDIVTVSERAAIDQMLVLNRRCGVLAGPTTGGTFAGAVDHLRSTASSRSSVCTAVFIACDRVEWYVSYLEARRPELFGANPDPAPGIPEDQVPAVSVDEAPRWIAKTKPLIVDSRSPVAFKANHIPDSINIPAAAMEEMVKAGVPFSNGHTVLLVCPQGEVSRRYASRLIARGARCFTLDGGILAWRDAGLALERSETRA